MTWPQPIPRDLIGASAQEAFSRQNAVTGDVGKTHLAHAPGDAAIRRRITVHCSRADEWFTRLRAARLDDTLEAEMRRLARVDLLILDDLALPPLDPTETNDLCELVMERHARPPPS